MRCDCTGKFTGLETGEPQEENAEVDGRVIKFNVRLTRNCSECGDEKKEYTYELDADISDTLEAHEKEKHGGKEQSYSVEADYDADESGGGRYAKNEITVNAHYEVTCDECSAEVDSGDLSDSAPASAFDEM